MCVSEVERRICGHRFLRSESLCYRQLTSSEKSLLIEYSFKRSVLFRDVPELLCVFLVTQAPKIIIKSHGASDLTHLSPRNISFQRDFI